MEKSGELGFVFVFACYMFFAFGVGELRATKRVADGLAASSKKHSVYSRKRHSRCKPVWVGWIGAELQPGVVRCSGVASPLSAFSIRAAILCAP